MRRSLTRSKSRPSNDDERILPLINIVFLLLIFFMVVGQLSAADPFEVVPPTSASNGQLAQTDITILVGENQALALNGQESARTQLLSGVAEILEGTPNAQVKLKVDGQVDSRFVIGLLQDLRVAGVAQVELLTQPKSSG